MDFTRKKLSLTEAPQLRVCPIESVAPYALMLAPVYVYLKRNEKYVAVKAPLDFFTPAELERLKSFEAFFLPASVDLTLAFRDAGRKLRVILSWEPPADETGVVLPPAPFEISDAVLRTVGPLWSGTGAIEPFFVSVLVNELCDPIDPQELELAREQSVAQFELGLMRSAWAVFLLLHLGCNDRTYLSQVREQIFSGDPKLGGDELEQLIALTQELIPDGASRPISKDVFASHSQRIARKIAGRIERVTEQLLDNKFVQPSIRGKEGFLDA